MKKDLILHIGLIILTLLIFLFLITDGKRFKSVKQDYYHNLIPEDTSIPKEEFSEVLRKIRL